MQIKEFEKNKFSRGSATNFWALLSVEVLGNSKHRKKIEICDVIICRRVDK
jgi:hypothetical protein